MKNLKEKVLFKTKSLVNKIAKPNIVTIVELETTSGAKRKFYGESLLGNFLSWVYLNFHDNDSNFALNDASWDTSGTGRGTLIQSSGSWTNITANRVAEIKETAGDNTYGIQIGTGTSGVNFDDYALGSIIGVGTGAGQMSYGAQGSIQGITVSGNTGSFILNRLMTNNSGATIDVTEIGIMAYSVGAVILLYRDTFSAISVADGETLNAKITFSVTS
jgi:hypothetical protein